LQSLDAEFRWGNYQNALLVAIPASAFFLLWPLVPLYRRHREARDLRLARVERQLGRLPSTPPDDVDAWARLETLLAHRDRLQNLRLWPLSSGLLSRVGLYLVIPPLAWVAAAVVQRGVDRLLGG